MPSATINDIVLEPVAFDKVTIPTAERKYYDPKMKFLKVGSNGTVLTFDIDKIFAQYRKDRTEVVRLTIPSALYNRKRNSQQQVATLWEMGGLNQRGGYGKPSSCVIVGTATGGRVSRHDVCTVRYPTTHSTTYPSGRHAVIVAQPWIMFTIAQRTSAGVTALVYKVDDVADWSEEFGQQKMPIQDKNGQRFYVALNCSLVGIRQFDGQDLVGWASGKLNEAEVQGVDRLFRLAREKLNVPAMTACNIELFWEAASNSTERNNHEAPVDTDVANHVIRDGDDFVSETIRIIGEYRKILNSSDLTIRSHPIPASVHYLRNDDNSIEVTVEVPSALGDSHPHFSISTTLTETLPPSLVAEPILANQKTSFDELLNELTIGEQLTKNIFTFC